MDGTQLPLFVYGILRSEIAGRRLIGYRARRVRPAEAVDQALYTPGGAYVIDRPGIDPPSVVVGELVELHSAIYVETLERLDQLEGYRPAEPPWCSHYIRVARPVRCAGETRLAWVYHAGPDVAWRLREVDRVPDGDYASRYPRAIATGPPASPATSGAATPPSWSSSPRLRTRSPTPGPSSGPSERRIEITNWPRILENLGRCPLCPCTADLVLGKVRLVRQAEPRPRSV